MILVSRSNGPAVAIAAGAIDRYYMGFKDGVAPMKEARRSSDFLQFLTKL